MRIPLPLCRFLVLSGLLVACSSPENVSSYEVAQHGLSFDEYRHTLPWVEPKEGYDGFWIAEGDLPFYSEQALREHYQQRKGSQALVIQQRGGHDTRRSSRVRYCIDVYFTRDYSYVATNLATAMRRWEEIINVRFEHVVAEDESCTATNPRIDFAVLRFDWPGVTDGVAFAVAPLPSFPKENQILFVDVTLMRGGAAGSADRVLTHEVGHVLGFMHEHQRADSGCAVVPQLPSSEYRALTPYDRLSVMHYPAQGPFAACGGRAWSFELNDQDRLAAQCVYGPAPGLPTPSADACRMLAMGAGSMTPDGASTWRGPGPTRERAMTAAMWATLTQ